ncbi:MAG TPA: NAD(P)/FAD-dependent oxidoreductase [Candidatus Methylomirabilis sp.]|nr:NAD(P)/FAD-dependent oxidoreductase [Candidatus Methylomirabilis sp.]
MRELELVILGSGPAGLAAAIEAAKAGASVTVLDENARPGGQIYRQLNAGFSVTTPEVLGSDYQRGQELLAEFGAIADRVEYLDDTLVWALSPERELAFLRRGASQSVRYRQLIIAVGAYDRPVPFPGWTLPGVFTAGGAQRLIKTQRVLPGDKILLAGTGPLQLAVANQIVEAGGKVEAILEAGNIDKWLSLARGAWGQWTLIADAWHYWSGIRKAGIPLWREHVILEARGEGRVEEAVIARVDQDWRPVPGTSRTLPVDTVCVGYGFVPSVELTRLAGCEHRYDPLLGGWVPVRGEDMTTSVPNVYAAGDCAGVAGSFVAIEEGRIAGLAVAQALGRLSRDEFTKRMQSSRERLAGLTRLRKALDEISVPRPGLYALATDDTILCRCEEVTLGEIKAALVGGVIDMNEVKRATRMGMGNCQGRMCGPALQEIIARACGISPADIRPLNPRPPIKPVPITALAGHTEME